MECDICFEDVEYLIKFDCGHFACETCTPKLKICPWCSTTIENEPALLELSIGRVGVCITCAWVAVFSILCAMILCV